MFHDNLIQLRKLKGLTQEALAEKVGVTRQAIAKWEAGDSVPDLEKCRLLAETFGVTLDDLANYEPDAEIGQNAPPPKGKHLFGVVTVGDKGQIVIPVRARRVFNINPGDQLMVLGDENSGLALVNAQFFMSVAEGINTGF